MAIARHGIAIAAGIGAGGEHRYGGARLAARRRKPAEQQLAGRAARRSRSGAALRPQRSEILAQQTGARAAHGSALRADRRAGADRRSPGARSGWAAGAIGAGLENTPGYQFRLNEGHESARAQRGRARDAPDRRHAQGHAALRAGRGESANTTSASTSSGALADLGYNAAGQTANLGMNYAQRRRPEPRRTRRRCSGTPLPGRATPPPPATIGSANAWQQGIGSAGNIAQMYYLSRLFQPGGGAGGGGGTDLPMDSGQDR